MTVSVDSGTENFRRSSRSLPEELFDPYHDPTKCSTNTPFVWCLQADYNREKHPFSCINNQTSSGFQLVFFFQFFTWRIRAYR